MTDGWQRQQDDYERDSVSWRARFWPTECTIELERCRRITAEKVVLKLGDELRAVKKELDALRASLQEYEQTVCRDASCDFRCFTPTSRSHGE